MKVNLDFSKGQANVEKQERQGRGSWDISEALVMNI